MTYQSSYFGEVRSFDSRPHKGNDYAAPAGTPTYAAAAGTVVIAGWSNSAGNWVVINHGNGLVTKYMHHSAICVTAGQKLQKDSRSDMLDQRDIRVVHICISGRIKWNGSKSKYIFVVC